MDEMKIKSAFLKAIVSKIIKKSIKRKTGANVDVHLEDLDIVVIDGKAKVHLEANAVIEKDDLTRIVNNMG